MDPSTVSHATSEGEQQTKRSPISEIPEEILLQIFEYTLEDTWLENDVYVPGSTAHPNVGESIRCRADSFVTDCMLVNKDWARVGREYLHRSYDVSVKPHLHSYLLLDRLLDDHGLRPKIHNLTIGFCDEDDPKLKYNVLNLIPRLAEEVDQMQMADTLKKVMKANLYTRTRDTCMYMLCALLNNLQRLRLIFTKGNIMFFRSLARFQHKYNLGLKVHTVELVLPFIGWDSESFSATYERDLGRMFPDVLSDIDFNLPDITTLIIFNPNDMYNVDVPQPIAIGPIFNSRPLQNLIIRGGVPMEVLLTVGNSHPSLHAITFQKLPGGMTAVECAEDEFIILETMRHLERLTINTNLTRKFNHIDRFHALKVLELSDTSLQLGNLDSITSLFSPNLETMVLESVLVCDKIVLLFELQTFLLDTARRPRSLKNAHIHLIETIAYSDYSDSGSFEWERIKGGVIMWQPLARWRSVLPNPRDIFLPMRLDETCRIHPGEEEDIIASGQDGVEETAYTQLTSWNTRFEHWRARRFA
ncbi:hypothetical protein M011DRAFT_526828 [Sporormia fimetaria CBS 119925]|uniref:Uncharacterized protein n=1 Tax=Sporormia fimetaria CBS 119925 TaxID=1340428 RepID=A0A6A6VB32_9PLEO|nr:hypothetical protein M011DRAFT_526828 [Sporormia fimetaria CBS 119925]